ncbi:hypothetical protein [Longimicrobium sp.]|uniref:hypothetical protein n=1 Tax=Longimicrobium sp. TaxID=2029185 RepID=UPI002C7D3370|nr:hypothetical protein [Longimicrobium sp.]HSU13262.1 hypothetical protein [Longimicrobium sp.]
MDSPPNRPLRLRFPDAEFRLEANERGKIIRGFDADALERLLASVTPDFRADILSHFQMPAGASARKGALTEFFDPVLQSILEEVWAPMWHDASDEALDAPDAESHSPGRRLARERREASRARHAELE